MFIRFDVIHERDRQTDTACRHATLMHRIARQKLSFDLNRKDTAQTELMKIFIHHIIVIAVVIK